MSPRTSTSADATLADLGRLLPDLQALYTDIHAHPELSMQENRTAGVAADRPRAAGYDVTTGVGETGVVGLPRNGDGPTVMLRTDMTASEDFGSFGAEWHSPAVFWFVGGTDPELYAKAKAAGRLGELPTNHNPRFAPVIHPTLGTGMETLVVAAEAWLVA